GGQIGAVHIADQLVAGLGIGADEARTAVIVAQRPPQFEDALGQGIVRNSRIAPDIAQQFVFRDNAAAALHEVKQKLERLVVRPKRYTVAADRPRLQINLNAVDADGPAFAEVHGSR